MPGPRIPVRVRHLTGDPQTDRADTERDELAGLLRLVPFLRGRLVSVQFSATVDKVVSHRLGVPAGWFVIRENYNGSLTDSVLAESTSQAGLDPNNQIRIIANGDCTVDIWFYARSSKLIDVATGQSR